MRRRLALAAAGAALLASGCMQGSLRVAAGMISHNLCTEAFVSGIEPARAFTESLETRTGMGLIDWAVRYEVDEEREEVRSSIAGRFEARAIHRPGLGCLLLRGEAPAAVTLPAPQAPPPLLPEIAGPAPVEPSDERLRAALERAFAEPGDGPPRRTRAVVVAHAGRIVAERYAPGFGVESRLLGYSATKSVLNALIGILVREGRISLEGPAPVAAWADPKDPRHAITIDQLLRMTSGLALAESGTPWSPVARMLYDERDMAAFAASARLTAEPGSEWHYSSGSTLILSGIVKDAAGGRAEDVVRFARSELFEPLGMGSAVLELDATGTPVGSTYMLATARDWLRFGLLHLDDGVAGGRRILPEGWVERSATPTLATGYGAGFWTNRGPGQGLPGAPPDTFLARGLLGQYVVIVPSHELVVVRLGATPDAGDPGVARLVDDVIRALEPPR